MKIGSLIGWGIAIGGGYILLKSLGYDPLDFIHMASAGTPVVTGGTGTSTSPQANNPIADNTLSQLLSWAKAHGMDTTGLHNTDYWNYLYQMVRGISAPAPEDLFPGVDRGKNYSIAEWWSAMTGKGMSGLGIIANRINPYTSYPLHVPFGSNLQALGSEKFIKRLN